MLVLLNGIHHGGIRMRHDNRIQLGGKAGGRHTCVLRGGYLADGVIDHSLQCRFTGAETCD